MKAVVEVAQRGSAVRSARQQVRNARRGHSPDYHLSFESAGVLFSSLTPARLELLDVLRRSGPCDDQKLAQLARRDPAEVKSDVARLEELGLVERGEANALSVPFDAVEILVPLARVA
jgi:predicted transcriptional regulator